MSLDVTLRAVREVVVFDETITHNLAKMADAAGLFYPLWHPQEHGYRTARDLVPTIRLGLERLEADPGRFRTFNSDNGWGTYEDLVKFVRRMLDACEANPEATVEAW